VDKKPSKKNEFDADSKTLKMEVTCSSETLADFQRTTRRCIPEDNNHRCENLKGYILSNGSTICEEEIGIALVVRKYSLCCYVTCMFLCKKLCLGVGFAHRAQTSD
jgi:hypothetical protein